MRDVYVIGAGQTPYGAFPERSYRDLFAEAYAEARDAVDRPVDPADVDEAVVGTLGVGGRQLGLPGPAVTEHVGLHGVPCSRIENACAAGGSAVRQGIQAIRSGHADVVLAGGFEAMTDASADATKYWLGVSGETEWERLTGTTFSGVYAQMASAYFDAYDASADDLAHVAVKNHTNGSKNPKAHLDFECSLEDARDAPEVAAPLNLYHCCPTSDGAAVAFLAAGDVVDEYTDERVRIAGAGAASDHVGLAQRDRYTAIDASETAAETAYDRADVGPDDLDVAEVHDCFAIAELLAYEDLGFCDRGEAATLLREGVTDPDGELPVNTSGGLKSKGHPIGATGVGQVVELFEQLTGRAGDRQLDDPRLGLAHNVGGSGGAAVVHVFEQEGVVR
ncbi:thiolase domain-containing protein [Salinarchaeum laminariae]|uniref:thiolase domain-containing protein n=1 Tax=Salinarchaeum laminariae TaxID=869888 RepID=UPI0020BFA2B8|nr:thiolase domain-containing protein [Salinarchaeum laminariae]